MKYFETKVRAESNSEFICLKSEYQESELHELVRDLHFGAMPNDSIYECIAHLVEAVEDHSTYNSYIDTEPTLFIYTGDIRRVFADADHVFESAWDSLSDYMTTEKDLTPFEYQTQVVNGYMYMASLRVANWALEQGLFEGEE